MLVNSLPPELEGCVPRETLEKLVQYQNMLVDWQDRMNLVSRNTLGDAWVRHFVDSLQLLPLIPDSVRQITDIGSGAGFPGLVLATCRPDIQIRLVESTGKKCQFLKAVAEHLGLTNVRAYPERVEQIVSRETSPDLITARALASLNELLTMIYPWAKKNPKLACLFPKGGRADEEIAEAKSAGWRFDLSATPSLTDPSAKLLYLRTIQKR